MKEGMPVRKENFGTPSLLVYIWFSVSLPKAPLSIHADAMTEEEVHQKLERGYNDIAAGRVQNAAEAFAKFRENHWYETIYGWDYKWSIGWYGSII